MEVTFTFDAVSTRTRNGFNATLNLLEQAKMTSDDLHLITYIHLIFHLRRCIK